MDSKFRTEKFPLIIPNEERRISRINNYVPHRTPRFTSKERWVNVYFPHIIQIFNIIKYNICNSPLYKFIDWDSQVIFTNLITLLYHCSSKYILSHDLL